MFNLKIKKIKRWIPAIVLALLTPFLMGQKGPDNPPFGLLTPLFGIIRSWEPGPNPRQALKYIVQEGIVTSDNPPFRMPKPELWKIYESWNIAPPYRKPIFLAIEPETVTVLHPTIGIAHRYGTGFNYGTEHRWGEKVSIYTIPELSVAMSANEDVLQVGVAGLAIAGLGPAGLGFTPSVFTEESPHTPIYSEENVDDTATMGLMAMGKAIMGKGRL